MTLDQIKQTIREASNDFLGLEEYPSNDPSCLLLMCNEFAELELRQYEEFDDTYMVALYNIEMSRHTIFECIIPESLTKLTTLISLYSIK